MTAAPAAWQCDQDDDGMLSWVEFKEALGGDDEDFDGDAETD